MLAVPYCVKGIPVPRAEFGQPDHVTVILTCLSYYYEGLTQEQLELCFEQLLPQDDPMQEYEAWVGELPLVLDILHYISGINTESSEQRKHLIPVFSHNKATGFVSAPNQFSKSGQRIRIQAFLLQLGPCREKDAYCRW